MLKQRTRRHPELAAVLAGGLITVSALLFMTTMALAPRLAVGLVLGAILGFMAYAQWLPDGPQVQARLRTAGLLAGAIVLIGTAAALLLP